MKRISDEELAEMAGYFMLRDIPRLIAEVKAQRAEIERLKGELRDEQ